MITTFYASFAPICFTLLGLWLIVVQTRHAEWRRNPLARRRAYMISLSFALPGLMSLLSLVDPGNQRMWRVSFAAVAFVGLGAAVALWLSTRRAAMARRVTSIMTSVSHTVAGLIYALVITLAILPDAAGHVGLALSGLQLEAILLCVLVFLGVNVAWFLMFDETSSGRDRLS